MQSRGVGPDGKDVAFNVCVTLFGVLMPIAFIVYALFMY